MNTVVDQSGAAGIMFKDSYRALFTVTTGFLFVAPYSLLTHTERKATPICSICCNLLHYTVQCKARFRGNVDAYNVKEKMLTEATRFRSTLSTQPETDVSYLLKNVKT